MSLVRRLVRWLGAGGWPTVWELRSDELGHLRRVRQIWPRVDKRSRTQ